ncbi:ATP-binding cassette domain-containing protein [Paracoccus aminophilus]|uniref:ABC-type dipeptide/oligopeptide/nickel transport system, ATPase component n=1 Tax=Paracoccus aminophilus JCM 7686 TaxID=1367847 RepID=S5XT92_PARAH|nr:ABC transporter ATP-binding protein [Paracoccus aminophilus]AGT10704.1 ABC-type dipeptide/oligopeptide/nickel transport system, ATPase component [Paracoccus aminophilus JCM 7686]
MSLLTLRDLRVASAAKELVHGVSFTLEPGEQLGLVGESGSGKSLTAMSVVGLLATGLRASGSVLLGGQEVVGQPDRRLVPLRGAVASVVFQDPRSALDPLMRLGRQLAEPIRRRAAREGRALTASALKAEQLQWLDRVAIAEPERILAAFPHEVSGGQRQRIAIAMALACGPRLLIADEPTTALDVTTQAEVLDLLDGLVKAEGLALLFISHDLPVVARITDRVIVMRQGDVVEEGPARRVFTRPAHEYTKALVGAARRLEAALAGDELP